MPKSFIRRTWPSVRAIGLIATAALLGPQTAYGEMHSSLAATATTTTAATAVATSQPFDAASFDVGLDKIADGFDAPLYVVDPGDGSDRLFVVEQTGRVRILENGKETPRDEPFLDLSDQVSGGSEQGLLSMAFDPNYEKNGLVYVDYTDLDGDTRVVRYKVAADDRNRVDPESALTILTVDQPYANHNGGLLLFGPDGMLYVGLGDGGAAGDPEGNGQNRETLLGKILRLDVRKSSQDEPYAIPKDNPFVGESGARPELWAYGLRNPWRFSFDRATDDLYIADVGQNAYEEVNAQPAGKGGQNYGWDLMEGKHCYEADECASSEFVAPVAEYSHDDGCSVTGGYVYRGKSAPALDGVYLFADYCSGLLWGLGRDGNGDWALSKPIETGLGITSFGEDESGDVYLTDREGGLYRVTEPDSAS